MDNGSRLSKMPGADPRIYSGSRIVSMVQTVVGPLVVAGIIWLVADRNRAWESIDSFEHDLEIHIIKGVRKHDLLERDFAEIRYQLNIISEQLAVLDATIQKIILEVAKLPPDEWERRILKNERDILNIKSRAEE